MKASSARSPSTSIGDITGPFRLWRIQNGEVTTVGEMSTADVDAIKAKIAQ